MLYSKSAHAIGGSGFFLDGDNNAPADSVAVAEQDFLSAINLPQGSTYTFAAQAGAIATLSANGPDAAYLLARAKDIQLSVLHAAYRAAIQAPVSFTTAAGTTAQFSQDATSVSNLEKTIMAGAKSQTFALGLWLDVNGQPVTPFTYADLQGLSAAMEAAEFPAFTELLSKIAGVTAATTVDAVKSITF